MSLVGEPAEGLGAVVCATQHREVLDAGLSGWSALSEGDVGGDVVQVGPGCGDTALGEHAGLITQAYVVDHPRGRVVDIDRGNRCRVQDGSDGDVVSACEPAREPVHQEGSQFRGPGHTTTPEDPGLDQVAVVDVEHDHRITRPLAGSARLPSSITAGGLPGWSEGRGGGVGDVFGCADGGVVVGVGVGVGVGGVTGQQGQGLLGVGQHSHAAGTTHVQGPGVAQGSHHGGHLAHGVVERHRIGGVEDHAHPRGARGALVVIDTDFPTLQRMVVVGCGPVGVGIEAGLVDQHPNPVGVQPGWSPRQQPVGMCGCALVQIA